MADKGGYIGRSPGDSNTIITRETFEPTGVQTNFTITAGYKVGYIDIYLNGVRLIEGSDFTANDTSIVGLTSAAQNGDILETVAYKAFNIANSLSNVTGSLTVPQKLTVAGISSLTDVVSSGIVTADAFYGDGGNLTGLPGQRDFWTKTAAGINTTVSVGVGTTRPDSIARSNNDNILNVGILTAYKLYGDGSNLTNLPGQEDLWSKTAAGINTLSSVGVGTTNPVADLTVGPVGASGTSLFVHGDARITGVVTANTFDGTVAGSDVSGAVATATTSAVPGISTQLHTIFNTVNASGIVTAATISGTDYSGNFVLDAFLFN
tara:strand:+ start:538 stop:1500 length:963 start_codon:yes stop_codon:yes gene_type:complete